MVKQSMNFAGSGLTQRKRVTASSVADVLSIFLTQSEIEQLKIERDAIKQAISDVLAHKERNGMVGHRVMIGIALRNGLKPRKLMQSLEDGGHIRPGATSRFEEIGRGLQEV